MIIDFHTHTFPEEVGKKALPMMAETSGIQPWTNATNEQLITSMKKNGIDYSVLMPVATRPKQVEKLNNIAAELNGKDGLLSFGAMHVDFENYKEEFKRIKELGLKGIKLHHDYMGIFFSELRSLRVISEAFEQGLMVLVHAGDDPYSKLVHHCTPEMIKAALPDLRGGTLIAAHYGGLMNADSVEEHLLGEDVYIDTSMTHYHSGIFQLKRILLGHDPDKILFGTDSPWDDQGISLKVLDSMQLDKELKEKILYKNAMRLLGMES